VKLVKVKLLIGATEGAAGETVEVSESRAKSLIRGGAGQPANKTAAKAVDEPYPKDKK